MGRIVIRPEMIELIGKGHRSPRKTGGALSQDAAGARTRNASLAAHRAIRPDDSRAKSRSGRRQMALARQMCGSERLIWDSLIMKGRCAPIKSHLASRELVNGRKKYRRIRENSSTGARNSKFSESNCDTNEPNSSPLDANLWNLRR